MRSTGMPSRAAASRFWERAPHPRAVEKLRQREHQQPAAAENPEQLIADRNRPDLKRAAGGEFRIGPRLIAQSEDDDLFDEELDGERREDDREQRRLPPPHRIDDEYLDKHADAGDQHGRQDRRQPHRQAEPRQQRMREHAAEHDEHALREVHDATGVVNDAKADRDQPIDQSNANAVDEALNEFDAARHFQSPRRRDKRR
jgi:hypothetical protein